LDKIVSKMKTEYLEFERKDLDLQVDYRDTLNSTNGSLDVSISLIDNYSYLNDLEERKINALIS
jgi:hypothetical protein